jgi:hypothetical protein
MIKNPNPYSNQNIPDKIVTRISIGVIVFALAIISEMLVGEKSMKKATTFALISAIFSLRGAMMPLKFVDRYKFYKYTNFTNTKFYRMKNYRTCFYRFFYYRNIILHFNDLDKNNLFKLDIGGWI